MRMGGLMQVTTAMAEMMKTSQWQSILGPYSPYFYPFYSYSSLSWLFISTTPSVDSLLGNRAWSRESRPKKTTEQVLRVEALI